MFDQNVQTLNVVPSSSEQTLISSDRTMRQNKQMHMAVSNRSEIIFNTPLAVPERRP